MNLEPFLFPAEYDDGLSIEIQVNPEFGSPENAQIYALKYAEVIGRLTTELRKDVQSSWIHSCLLYTSPSPRDNRTSRMPSSA